MFPNAIKSIVPINFILMTTGTYQVQNLHSWDLTGNTFELNNLTRHINQTAATSVTPNLLAAAGSGMLTVSNQHSGPVNIADGWGSKRAVFILKFHVTYNMGNVFEWIVQGYTDHAGYTPTSIDPNMVLYINNVFCMARTSATYQGHQVNKARMMSDYQVVNGFAASSGSPGGNLLIRPQDVFSNISTADMLGHVNVIDSTQLANFSVQTSKHSNNIASAMLSDTLNVWHAASVDVDPTMGSGAIADRAYANVLETQTEQDMFMSLLSRHSNTGVTSSSFTGAQLMRAVDGIMQVYRPVDNAHIGTRWSSSADGASLAGTGIESKIAVNIQAMLPSIMVECMLAGVAFTVTNHSGQVEFNRSYVSAFVPEMDLQQWEVFKARVEREILPFFTTLGVKFSLMVSCSFFQEIKIDIRVTDHVEFVAPAFCNSLFSPVQTTSTVHAREFAQTMEYMANTVGEALMESSIRRARIDNQNIDNFAVSRAGREFIAPPVVNTAVPLNIASPVATPVVHSAVQAGMAKAPSEAPVHGMRK